jgi:hypothetical protein
MKNVEAILGFNVFHSHGPLVNKACLGGREQLIGG